jgi:excisionase family DNA binding protein
MAEKLNLDWEPKAPLLLTFEQVGLLLNVSSRTVRRFVARRELIARQLGGRTLILRSSIDVFLRRPYHATESDEEKAERRRRKAEREQVAQL